MNYAQDRLDRRDLLLLVIKEEEDAKRIEGREPKWNDTQHGQISLSVGWNDHALYHYGKAWYKEPENCHRMSDYAQMMELSGYPERALFVVLAYRMLTTSECVRRFLQPPTLVTMESPSNDPSSQPHISVSQPPLRTKLWYEQSAADMRGRHCGCFDPLCGYPSSTRWLTQAAIEQVLDQLQSYCSKHVVMQFQYQLSGMCTSIPTAHEILGAVATDSDRNGPRNSLSDLAVHMNDIPKLLQFWNDPITNDNIYLPFEPVTQLLCLKLLFLVLPSLAIASLPVLRAIEPDAQYKSHCAYYIFLHSLVLGERIKPDRRRQMKYQHIALWDRLWGISTDHSIGRPHPVSPCCPNVHEEMILDFIKRLQGLAEDGMCDTDHSPVWLPPILRPISTSASCDALPITPRPLYIVGDSHVLSLAWQFIRVPASNNKSLAADCHREPRLVVPILVTGLKAWHLRNETRFFTHTCIHTMLRRLPKDVETILISAGEIDCREGMGGPLLQGYTQACHQHIQATVAAYLSSLARILDSPHLFISQILILPVAPHVQRTKGRVIGRASRRETMRVWNDELRRQLQPYRGTLYLLDYADQVQIPPPIDKSTECDDLAPVPYYVLNPIFNADSTHMNSAFAPFLEQAIINCGCDVSKL